MIPNFSSLQKLTVPPQSDGVTETLNCCAFYLYNSGMLSTTVSLLYLKDAILFLQCLPFYVYISNIESTL